ncbi:MAG: AbrB/MazE/SpoVT family DNA-binding domain-containing protein [Planctomycetaceae bacterium]
MKTELVQVGRSKAVKIPSSLLRKTNLPDQVEVTAVADSLLIKPLRKEAPPRKPRAGWSAAFARMHRNDDDKLLDDLPVSLSSWDEEEWQW